MINVKKIIIHKKFYSDKPKHDIALLFLSKPLNFSKNIGPICLPKPTCDVTKGELIYAAWEKTANDLYTLALKEGRGGMSKKCSTELFICIESTREKLPQVDKYSGGPLMKLEKDHRYNIVGIVSHSVRKKKKLIEDYSLNVLMYLKWIKRHVLSTFK